MYFKIITAYCCYACKINKKVCDLTFQRSFLQIKIQYLAKSIGYKLLASFGIHWHRFDLLNNVNPIFSIK